MTPVRVACDVPQSTLGPIAEAKRKLDAVLGKDSDFMDQARDLFVTGLRRRFLGDVPERGPSTAALVDVCHRVAATGRQYALVFDAVDAADAPTLEVLRRIVRREGGLGLPLVLTFRDRPPEGAAEALLQVFRQSHGDDAVISSDRAPSAEDAAPSGALDFDVRQLPADVRQVLRAGAVIGSGFEADLVAELLERSYFAVLDCLQRAADAGVPIDDRGEERFFLPEPVIDTLLGSTLPSLKAAWHRRLGWLLTEAAAPLAPSVSTSVSEPLSRASTNDERSPNDSLADSLSDSISGTLDELGLGALTSGQIIVQPETDGTVATPTDGADTTVVIPAIDSDGNDERTIAIALASTGDSDGMDYRNEDTISDGTDYRHEDTIEETDADDATVRVGPKASDTVKSPAVSVQTDAPLPGAERGATAPAPQRPTLDLFANVFAAETGGDGAVPEAVEAVENDRISFANASARPDSDSTIRLPRIHQPTRREIPVVVKATRRSSNSGRPSDDSPTLSLPAEFDTEAASITSELPRSDSGRTRRDPARAAIHLSAAGQIEAAARKYASAAGEASAIGAYEQAMAHGRKALRTIESLPTTPDRRRFRAQLLVSLARLQWQAAGLLDGHPDPAFTLDSALQTADVALASIEDDDPDDLVTEAREVTAGICYDMGSKDALERALYELSRCARLFLQSGKTLQAARLLNDQAAVYVRLGDPVRATHMLGESQKIFEHRAADDPLAIRELAETHHLLARLPLHAAIRPGREDAAYDMAMQHATEAENRYRHLGAIREIARVWESMGRLELANGNLKAATERLESALQVQSQTGDLTGLARSTGALSDVLAASDRPADALAVLGDSITLNTEKGSPIGLAFNRRALTKLAADVADGAAADSTITSLATDIRKQLEAAENQLGRVALPPEPGQ